jgi:hypothetical protein
MSALQSTVRCIQTLGLGLSSWLRRMVRSFVDRVSSAWLFCLFRNKNAMVREGPGRRGNSPTRGEGGGLWAPDSCYLDGKNMQTVFKSVTLAKGCCGGRLQGSSVCCRDDGSPEPCGSLTGRCNPASASAVILAHPLPHG